MHHHQHDHSNCCGHSCSSNSRSSSPAKPAATPSTRALKSILAALALTIAGASTIALTQAPAAPAAPATPTVPTTPAAPKTPDTMEPGDRAESPATPTRSGRPIAPGAIRHGVPTAPPKPDNTVRVATYNVENLFAPPPAKPDGTPGTPQSGREPKPVEHQKAVAAAIIASGADILALQEVESLETLTAFRDTYLKDAGFKYIASIDAGDDRGIEQSVISKFPITDIKNWPHLEISGTHNANRTEKDRTPGGPIQFKRTPLRVTVSVPPPMDAPPGTGNYQLTLFSVHFKSGRSDSYWRERESLKTAQLAKEFEAANPNANILILGDFNARPQEKTVRNALGQGFIDAFDDLTDDPKYQTHASDRVIDHILLNRNVQAEMVKDTRFVLGTMNRAAGVDWRTTEPPPGYASDHYPVVIDLKTIDQPLLPVTTPATPAAPPTDKPAPAPAKTP